MENIRAELKKRFSTSKLLFGGYGERNKGGGGIGRRRRKKGKRERKKSFEVPECMVNFLSTAITFDIPLH